MTTKILLVDDVTMFLELMKGFLRLSAVHLITAKDGVEALQLAKKERPALIFMDLHMPRMDGAACCARIKEDPELRRIPVVMITAEGKEEDRARCQAAGCDAFLTKPLDRNLFLAMARRQLPNVDRRDTRIKCRAKVRFKAHGLTLSAEILDLSEHGVYIATDYQVEQGVMLDISFVIPDANGVAIQGRGRIAWVNSKEKRVKKDMPEGFGVELTSISEEGLAAMTAFVRQAG